MKILLSIFITVIGITSFSQNIGEGMYNHVSKLSIGYSQEHLDHYLLKKGINDTGAVALEFNGWAPSVSYTHEFVFGKVMSICGNIGFQYMNLDYGAQKYGGTFMYLSVAPKVTVVRRKSFEYYMKLKAGGLFYFHKPDIIPEPARRFLPEKANVYAGITVVGLDFLFDNNLGFNMELSVFSPEFITAGITYRFYSKSMRKLTGK